MSMKQPRVNAYIRALSRDDFFGITVPSYDTESCRILDEIFNELEKIRPISENGAKSLWFTAERGTLKDFGNVDELIDEGEYESEKEFIEVWQEEFPDEIAWYAFAAVNVPNQKCRTITMQHRVIIAQDDSREASAFPYDITEFVQWILESVRACITMLKEGTYNAYINEKLPPQHRTGTIRRKDYWDVWPDQRDSFFQDITTEEVELFCDLVRTQAPLDEDQDRICNMTANDFYRSCALGYAANHYSGCDKPAKEQYYLHADGRDDGLKEIDADSAEAFHIWLNDRDRFGGHPWEVCRGGNSTHISLYVHEDRNGCILILSGSAWNRTIETVKFYLALKSAGVPVFLNDADMLADRLTEEEKIGIVPQGVIPAYCSSYFPGQKVIDYINLPYEDREKFIPYCEWQPEQPVLLSKEKGDNMSYDICLTDPVTRKTIEVADAHFMQGGTYIPTGSNELWLNVTYNYSRFYYMLEAFGDKGIRSIYGKTGYESIPILEKAISELGDDTDPDYWKPTEGNAKKPLLQLLAMAHMRPDGIWDGD